VLGPDTLVERTEHIVSGGRRCVYGVRPGSASGKEPEPTFSKD
jgi:hypothetical protein